MSKLPIKKTGFLFLIMAGLFLMNIGFVEAEGWVPITDLSSFGIPADTEVTLSDFIITLYNFLLSAVGIAAMFMIVVGGFRYLTAAGNAASLSEAKDIIYSALYGLLLAICAWVFISTINPDLVYLKQPGADVEHKDYGCINTGLACAVDGKKCCSESQTGEDMCVDGKCEPIPPSCVASDGWQIPQEGKYFEKTGKWCKCIDGKLVLANISAPENVKCQDVCSDPMKADDGKYHGVNTILKITGKEGAVIFISNKGSGENFIIKKDEPMYYDLSDSYDCSGEIVSFAVNFNGKPDMYDADLGVPDRWCCMMEDSGCVSTWGNCCRPHGCWFLFKPPLCSDTDCGGFLYPDMCTYFEPNADESNYPIYKKSYGSSGKKEIWVGIVNKTSEGDIKCYDDTEKFFRIDVVD